MNGKHDYLKKDDDDDDDKPFQYRVRDVKDQPLLLGKRNPPSNYKQQESPPP